MNVIDTFLQKLESQGEYLHTVQFKSTNIPDWILIVTKGNVLVRKIIVFYLEVRMWVKSVNPYCQV